MGFQHIFAKGEVDFGARIYKERGSRRFAPRDPGKPAGEGGANSNWRLLDSTYLDYLLTVFHFYNNKSFALYMIIMLILIS
jgi:hypothetical protein